MLVMSGNDPSGGAGIQADIQAITALGVHPAPVITTLTVQDTCNASEVAAVDADLVVKQAEAVLYDLDIRAIKIGLLGTAETARAVAQLLGRYSAIPVILDPVLVAAGGARLAETALISVLLERLLPLTTLLTPNQPELHSLVPGDDIDDNKAKVLLEAGADWVLVKGADADTTDVVNVLHSQTTEPERFTWPRFEGQYHGSGCTLAAAAAAVVASGGTVEEAVAGAQEFTWQAIRDGFRPGRGQPVPNRFCRLPGVE